MRWKGIKEKWLAVVQQTDANTIWHKQLFVLAATANALRPELWLGGKPARRFCINGREREGKWMYGCRERWDATANIFVEHNQLPNAYCLSLRKSFNF